ncbi:MAG: hypothetical protein LBV51_05505 [Acholeplasmatales bacterium]|jgi:arabinogalactan oligomer/maltooligosaccharide transport system substrate-binding protein|nr:hypothetical protein [Acholeplasmatales bacterium]
MKKILLVLVLFMTVFILQSCVSDGTSSSSKKPIIIWVGAEGVSFYQGVMDDYVASHEGMPKVEVKPSDAGTAANSFLLDTEEGVDIFTIPGDSLSELTSGSTKIAPILNTSLINQTFALNTPSVIDMISLKIAGSDDLLIFGVPYVFQNLVLYYNKTILKDVTSWENIIRDVETYNSQNKQSTKAFTLAGIDSFSNSFLLLASKNNSFPIKIYQDGTLDDCDITNDEAVSIIKKGQDIFKYFDKNSAGAWTSYVTEKKVAAVIGGAWEFGAATESFGSNLGIAKLPTFTINNDTYNSGTFNDVKMFVQRVGSPNAMYLQGIMEYLSSKEIQEQSYIYCNNLPSFKDARTEFDSIKVGTSDKQLLARAQYEMMDYGLPQPFGKDKRMHEYFYSRKADQLLINVLTNVDNAYTNIENIKAVLTKVEARWKKGND